MLWIALFLQASSPAADPLAPAFRGQVQCYSPDVARKACRSIGEYAKGPDGRIVNTATVLLSPNPIIVMRSAAPVEVKDGQVCGVIRNEDLTSASFTINGQAADAAAAKSLRDAIAPGFAPMLNREACTRFAPDGGMLKGLVSLDGERRPDLDQSVRWVAPGEGFSVKP